MMMRIALMTKMKMVSQGIAIARSITGELPKRSTASTFAPTRTVRKCMEAKVHSTCTSRSNITVATRPTERSLPR